MTAPLMVAQATGTDKYFKWVALGIGTVVVVGGGVAGYWLWSQRPTKKVGDFFGETLPSFLEDLIPEEIAKPMRVLAGTDSAKVEQTLEEAVKRAEATCDEQELVGAIEETDLTFQGLLTNPLDFARWAVIKARFALKAKDIAKNCAEKKPIDWETVRLESEATEAERKAKEAKLQHQADTRRLQAEARLKEIERRAREAEEARRKQEAYIQAQNLKMEQAKTLQEQTRIEQETLRRITRADIPIVKIPSVEEQTKKTFAIWHL